MIRLFHFRTVAALMACLALALSASAYDFVKDGIYYNINGTNVSVTFKDASYNSYSGTVNIPATVAYNGTTYNVSSIGPSAFQGCTDLYRVVIPNSVIYMMNNAFNGCTQLSNITIPASVFTIYNNVFAGCSSLRTVICLSPTVRNWSVNNFSTGTYDVAQLLVPSGCAEAYRSSTYCWGQFNSIKEIECDFVQDAVFYDDLGNNQAAVRNVARYIECYSGDIVIPETVTHDGNTYTVTSVSFAAFYYSALLHSLVLPNSVQEIGAYAFYDCSHLTSVNIPEGVTSLYYCTFGDCIALPSITIPASVVNIDTYTFNECNSLEAITCRGTTPPTCADIDCFNPNNYTTAALRVPSQSLSAYQSAPVWQNFNHIVGMDNDFEVNGIYYIITGPNTVSVTYRDRNFNSYSGAVNVPSTVTHDGITYTVTAVGRSAFYNSSDLTSVTLPNTVTKLDYGAFYGCSSLTSIDIPSGVTTLGEFCFQSCTALETISFNGPITTIPRQCFTYCSSLNTLAWPSTIKEIGPYALYECSSLGSLILPDDLETLQPYALANCRSLSGVVIPGKVSSIGQGVLSGCSGLYIIGVDQSNQHYTSVDRALVDIACDTLIAYPNMYTQHYTIPSGIKIIGPGAFGSCDNLLSVTFPEGVTSIEGSAFNGCINLQSVSLCSTITNIGSNAFYACGSLQSFNIPANVATIGIGAFSQCESMTEIQVDDNNPNFMDDYGVLYTSDGTRLLQYPSGRPDKHYSVLNTTTAIDGMAFANSAVKSVYLPKSLRDLDEETFASSQVERVVIDEGLEIIAPYTFYNCENLKSVYLPSTINSIGLMGFYYCVNLEEITIAVEGEAPDIGLNAFYGLAYYTDNRYANVYVPDGMASKYSGLNDWLDARGNFTDIEPLASGTTFVVDSLNIAITDDQLNAQITGVTSNEIVDPGIAPKVAYQGNLCTVTNVKDHTFAYLNKMIRADVPFTVQSLEDYSFYDCRNLEKLILRDGIRMIDGYAFSHINTLTSVEIPASVDSISGSAFTYDPALRYINVVPTNNNYTSVDGVLFSKDRKLLVAFPGGYGNSYQVPSGTATIGIAAFRGAAALEHVTFPETLRKISSNAFLDCSALTGVVVPEGVTVIGSSAFNKCSSMNEAELPSTLTELGFSAFNEVPGLTSLTVKATTPPTCIIYTNPRTGEIFEPFISAHYTNVTLYVPRGTKSAYQQANIWKKFTNIVEVDFPSETLRGDVNNDGRVNLSDVSALINYLLTQNASSINLEGADANLDDLVNVADVSALISYLLSQEWPEPAPIDMWYLWGNFFGSDIWGYQQTGYDAMGVSVLPMYPTGTFNANGKGILTWTGFVPHQYFTIVHTPGPNVYDELWGVNTSTGECSVMSSDDMGDEYSTFILSPDYYTITLNTATMTLSIEPYAGNLDAIHSFGSIAMPGDYNFWNTADNAMNVVNTRLGLDNHDWFVDEFTITSTYDHNGELKFSTYGNWDYNWGSTDFPYGTGVQNGQNIPVEVGTYKVFFNDITGQYHFIEKK